MSQSRQTTGQLGERLACQYLKQRKFRVLETNYRVRTGEIDIIATRQDEIHFIEVKARRSQDGGDPLEQVTPRKQQQIIKAARHYLSESRSKKSPVFSVLGVSLTGATATCEWIDNAFGVDSEWAL